MAEETMLREKVERLLDRINPVNGGHGGEQLMDVKDSTVYIGMSGGCRGCGAVDVTLKAGMERMISRRCRRSPRCCDSADDAWGRTLLAPSKA